jgi:hypothetical protein
MATKTAIEKGDERSAKRQEPGALARVWRRRNEQVDRIYRLSARCARGDAQGGFALAEGSEGDDGRCDRRRVSCSALFFFMVDGIFRGVYGLLKSWVDCSSRNEPGIESGMSTAGKTGVGTIRRRQWPRGAGCRGAGRPRPETKTEAPAAVAETLSAERPRWPLVRRSLRQQQRQGKKQKRPEPAAAAVEPQPVRNRELSSGTFCTPTLALSAKCASRLRAACRRLD